MIDEFEGGIDAFPQSMTRVHGRKSLLVQALDHCQPDLPKDATVMPYLE
jgi:hypothetical protein